MPFIPNTPESLLPRTDSKNPATTCKGITESGRPCRRSLATSPKLSPLPRVNRRTKDGVLAVLPGDSEHEGAAAFFCWQHKDQAATLQSGAQGNGNGTTLFPLTERTSIDTLVDRLGVLDIQDGEGGGGRKKTKQASRPVRKDTLPKKWHNVPGPLMALPHDESSSEKPPRGQKRRRPGFWESLCCAHSSYDSTPPAKPRPQRPSSTPPTTSTIPSSIRPPSNQIATSPKRPSINSHSPLTPPSSPFSNQIRRTSSHTQQLLALIPPSLSPQTTSALLSELAKPVSPHDEEGWIYIFWLTPNDSPKSDSNAVSSLLNTPATGRRASSVNVGKKILLKIGRASNVQRRMNEWTRQCGYSLSLVRFYPYMPSSSPLPSPLPSPSARPRARRDSSTASPRPSQGDGPPHKVPHAHKVERLIHLELAEQRVKKTCEACGKEHREWFEVAGTREGVKTVDEVVRRWVWWAERNT